MAENEVRQERRAGIAGRPLYSAWLGCLAPLTLPLCGAGRLLVLAHPRSGSTLLVHLLANAPEIVGYGETHVDYRVPGATRRLQADLLWHRPSLLFRRPRYLLDKILSPALFPPDRSGQLRPGPDRVLFLLREPRATYRSLCGGRFRLDGERAVDAYARRMAWLANLAEAMPEGLSVGWLTYADLVDATEATLTRLSRFLDLSQPLRPEYRTFRSTGRDHVGDDSANIFSGRVQRRAPVQDEPADDQAIARMEAARRACADRLRRRCQPLGPDSDRP